MVVMLSGLSSRQTSEQLLAASSKTSARQAWVSGPKLKHVAAQAQNMWPLHVTVVRASEATGNAPTDAGRRAERFTSPRRVHPAADAPQHLLIPASPRSASSFHNSAA